MWLSRRAKLAATTTSTVLGMAMRTYIFELEGHLDQRWESVFEGFSITHELGPDQRPITLMRGPLIDSSALYGLLGRLRDLGVTLTSMQIADPGLNAGDA
jgi:hypothetical protein